MDKKEVVINKKMVSELVLSELVFQDENNESYKTYSYQDKEYKLYGLIDQGRLEQESQFEYKVRRIFSKQWLANSLKPNLIWKSKNVNSARLYGLAKSITKPEDLSKIEKIREAAIASNLGTLDKKKLNSIVEEFKKQQELENESVKES